MLDLEMLMQEGDMMLICAKIQEIVPEYRVAVSPTDAFRQVFVDDRG